MKLVAALILISAIYVFNVSGGGFENFLCGKTPEANAKLVLGCDLDCQHQHGALSGACVDVHRGDFNCKCKGRAKVAYKASLQCMNQTDNFREVCNVDCICHHGAKGGYCDWENKACICRGENDKNVNCPFDNIPDFANYVLEKAGKDALGPYGMIFIEKGLQHKGRKQFQ